MIRRIAAARKRSHRRNFGGLPGSLSASAHWLAYAWTESKVKRHGDVGIVTSLDLRVRVHRRGGGARDPLPGCGGAGWITTAARGPDLVVAQSNARCDGRPGTRVWLLRAGEPIALIYIAGDDVDIDEIHLAGGRVAWSQRTDGGPSQIIVADLATGSEIERLSAADFSGGPAIKGFDLDARGNIVALSGQQPACLYACVDIRRVGQAGPARRISSRVSDQGLAIGHGRIAYIAMRGERTRHIVVSDLSGHVVQRLDRFGGSEEPVGELSIAGPTLVWATMLVLPEGRGRVRTRRLR